MKPQFFPRPMTLMATHAHEGEFSRRLCTNRGNFHWPETERSPADSPPSGFFVKSERAFTLVEVVLALGVCAFALISMMSLMPVSLDSARHAQEISRVAKAFEKVTSELTQSQFTNVAAMTTNTYFFDYEGKATDASGTKYTASSPDTYFTVRASIRASPIANQSSTNLLRVTLAAQTRRQTNAGDAGTTTVTIADMGY